MCLNCKSTDSLHQTVAAKNVPRFFSKTARTFRIHFSWKWERKKWGHHALFCSTNKTVSYRLWHSCQMSQIRQLQTGGCTRPLHPIDWSWRSQLNSELWAHSVAIRFWCIRGSLSCYVTTRSSYLKNLRFVQYFHRLLKSVQILLASIMLITISLVAVEPRRPPLTDVGTETAFRLDQRKHFRKSKHFLRSEVSWCDQTRIDLHLRRSTCTNE